MVTNLEKPTSLEGDQLENNNKVHAKSSPELL